MISEVRHLGGGAALSKLDRCYKVHVTKFDEYNPKAAGHSVEWFRCQSNLARSPEFLALSAGAKHVWLWVLCEGARSRTREVLIHPRDVSRETHLKPESIPKVLSEISALEWIRIVSSPHVRTNERTNVRNERMQGGVEEPAVQAPPTPKVNAPAKVEKKPGLTAPVIAHYCDLWKARYQSPRSPDITAADAGRMARFVKDVGVERAKRLIEAFLQMPDHWFVTKTHSIPTLMGNLPKVGLFADSGKMITRQETQQLDRQATNANTLQQLRDGKI